MYICIYRVNPTAPPPVSLDLWVQTEPMRSVVCVCARACVCVCTIYIELQR